jgi:hypothetical protein
VEIVVSLLILSERNRKPYFLKSKGIIGWGGADEYRRLQSRIESLLTRQFGMEYPNDSIAPEMTADM